MRSLPSPPRPNINRLTISFWIWTLWDTGTNGFFNYLELRMTPLVGRGFNCIRIEGGAGFSHDADGRPRGELELFPTLPGHGQFSRQMEHMTGGRVDLLKRLIELGTFAHHHNFKVILSSWYYLHTFLFTDERVTAELMGLSSGERFMYFGRGLDRIIVELKQRRLEDVFAFAEIFNEADGLNWVIGYRAEQKLGALLNPCQALHEEALAFLKTRHPKIRFALDTCTPWTNI